MRQFQKLAIGLLGLTHPEMFIPPQGTAQGAPRRRGGRGARIMRTLRLLLSALALGSRTVALADNSELGRNLAARARLLYRTD